MNKDSSDKSTAYCNTLLSEIEEYQHLARTNQLSKSDLRNPSDIIGHQTMLDGNITPIYKPKRGSIVTQAFIHCSQCGRSVYHCGGPRIGALCLLCVGVEYENPNIIRSNN